MEETNEIKPNFINFKLFSKDYLANLQLYYKNYPSNDFFSIKLNNNEICSLNLEIAIALSSTITEKLLCDPTIRSLNLNMDFKNEKSPQLISEILQGQSQNVDKSLFSDLNILYDFTNFGLKFGNSSFLKPSKHFFKDIKSFDFESLNIESILFIIQYKSLTSSIYIDHPSYSIEEEIKWLSQNFYKIISEPYFIEWSKQLENESLLEAILLDNDLLLENEDQLLSFVIELAKENPRYSKLFSYVYLENCSLKSVKQFIDFFNIRLHNLNISSEIMNMASCLTRRCTYNLNKYIKEPMQRYKIIKYEYQENNPRNGILFNQNQSNNVLLNPSSDNNPNNPRLKINHLLDDVISDFSFFTQDIPNSYIEISLKDNKRFIINNYMLRGNFYTGNTNQLKCWTLEGLMTETNQWYEIDNRKDQTPFERFEVRIFEVKRTPPLSKLRLTQTGLTASNDNYLGISGVEFYGYVI